MTRERLTIALISEVFFGEGAGERLGRSLFEARQRGAELAVLPEIPVNAWSPATKDAREDDAEPPSGARQEMMCAAAREASIALVGGAIVRDPATGVRRNTALTIDHSGSIVSTFSKLHVPEEPGFWETSHYGAGEAPAPVVADFGFPFGVQICSDMNRPEGSLALAAGGALAVLHPRATEEATYQRWRPVFVATAITACAYVVSVNRPRAEQGVLIGGPSICVAPDSEVLVETTDPVALVTLERSRVERARRAYPGYLPVRSDLYAKAWSGIRPTGHRN